MVQDARNGRYAQHSEENVVHKVYSGVGNQTRLVRSILPSNIESFNVNPLSLDNSVSKVLCMSETAFHGWFLVVKTKESVASVTS